MKLPAKIAKDIAQTQLTPLLNKGISAISSLSGLTTLALTIPNPVMAGALLGVATAAVIGTLIKSHCNDKKAAQLQEEHQQQDEAYHQAIKADRLRDEHTKKGNELLKQFISGEKQLDEILLQPSHPCFQTFEILKAIKQQGIANKQQLDQLQTNLTQLRDDPQLPAWEAQFDALLAQNDATALALSNQLKDLDASLSAQLVSIREYQDKYHKEQMSAIENVPAQTVALLQSQIHPASPLDLLTYRNNLLTQINEADSEFSAAIGASSKKPEAHRIYIPTDAVRLPTASEKHDKQDDARSASSKQSTTRPEP
ncbi:MAG: hypothetical protein ACRC6G_00490, partial [Deefgea sp.]